MPYHPILAVCIASLFRNQSSSAHPKHPTFSPVILRTTSSLSLPQSPVVLPGSQQMDGSEPVKASSETGTRVCSMAMNPLYEEPELQELYVDLGQLEAVNLMTFAYQIASGMVRWWSILPTTCAVLTCIHNLPNCYILVCWAHSGVSCFSGHCAP